MGRRPNQLVLEFFERGQKLEDSSNRYQHTCKRCRELFPKGRIDSLLTHLLRRCPNVTPEDQQLVLRHFHPLPGEQRRTSDLPTVAGAARDVPQQETQLQSEVPMPLLLQREPSALDTLAEVSRQHLDYSRQRMPSLQDHETGQSMSDEALMAHLQQASSSIMPDGQASSQAQEQALETFINTTTNVQSSPLVHAASAANEQLNAALQQQQHQQLLRQNGALDPQLASNDEFPAPYSAELAVESVVPDRQQGRAGPTDYDQTQQTDNSSLTWSSTNFTGGTQFGSLSASIPPHNGPNPAFGVLQKPTKNKARGRFNDTRRKEVQEIRKKGACIRCRMLKKPCSEGTPCQTCKNVEQARLWKSSCIRTRISEEFKLYSASFYNATAEMRIVTATQGLQESLIPGRIEATFFPETGLFVTFMAKRYSESSAGFGIDPNLVNGPSEGQHARREYYLIGEDDGITEKIESYIARVTPLSVDSEPSSFMRTTMHQALEILRDGKTMLVRNAMELCTATRILISAHEDSLSIRFDSDHTHTSQPVELEFDQSGTHPTSKRIVPLSPSHRLVRSQLLAAIESYCAKLSKVVMNELERRLLMRQQSSAFATFIASVILLNCVERMSGLFRSFDTRGSSAIGQLIEPPEGADLSDAKSYPPPDMQPNAAAFMTEVASFPGWPLDGSPSKYWMQGDKFSDLVITLLRMRALPPKTMIKSDGSLGVVQNIGLPVGIAGVPSQPAVNDQSDLAGAWLESVSLKVQELVQRKDAAIPDATAGPYAWDMRFIARVLMPERMQ